MSSNVSLATATHVAKLLAPLAIQVSTEWELIKEQHRQTIKQITPELAAKLEELTEMAEYVSDRLAR